MTLEPRGSQARDSKQAWIPVVLAVVLSPPFAMLYLNRAWRALLYLALLIAAASAPFLLAVAGLWPRGTPWWFIWIAVYAGGAVDAHRLAQANSPDRARPWYSRWYGLTVILLAAILLIQARVLFVEAFSIRSGSMMPTLLLGDNILVDKRAGTPRHGEVIVFRYPGNPALLYIMRVVGLPGDTVEYRDKRLVVNGKPAARELESDYQYMEGPSSVVFAKRSMETLGHHSYSILVKPDAPTIHLNGIRPFPLQASCQYSGTGFTCRVPAGHYFVLGDNRDSSSDSRYWGFVPEENVVGRACMIWWNIDVPERTGTSLQ